MTAADRRFPSQMLAAGASAASAAVLAQALTAAGHAPSAVLTRVELVQAAGPDAPPLIVAEITPEEVDPWVEALQAHRSSWAAVLVVARGLPADALSRLAAHGADACVSAHSPEALATAIAFAAAAASRWNTQRAELAQLHQQVDERKWIERAKGLLMDARSLSEDEAFKLLRSTAMQAQLRLPEVARSIIDVARWAEAVNRAGQLRMLSQRLVGLAVQRLLRVDGAGQRHRQALQRAQENIDFLATLSLDDAAHGSRAAVEQAWDRLKHSIGVRRPPTDVAAADAAAEALLDAAERLTSALETLGTRPILRVLNLCGRQRMRSQRAAKQALLGLVTPDTDRAATVVELIHDFEGALLDIEAAPLSSPEIRQALRDAREGWLLMMRAMRGDDALAIASASERLLEHLDSLTAACEHSLQLLLS